MCLTTVNLSFNRLEAVPSLHPDALPSSLLLAYNRLETLAGLAELISIQRLDLVRNCFYTATV